MEGSGSEPLAQARYLIESGDLTNARYLVRRSLADEPASVSALTLAGQIAVRHSALEEAVRQFRRASRAGRNDDPRPLLNLARAQQMTGRSRDAVATTQRAAMLFPQDPRPRGLLALLHLTPDTLDQAANALMPGDPARLDPDTAYKIGTVLKAEPRHRDLAGKLLVRAASTAGRFFEPALRELATESVTGERRTYQAARLYLVLSPDAVDVMDVVARVYEARQFPVKQAAWLWQAYCVRPDDRSRLRRVADLTHEVKWPGHGIAAHRLLLRDNPNDLKTISRICALFTRHRELAEDKGRAQAEAVAWAQSVLAANPRDPRIWDALVCLYKDVEAFDEAHVLWPRILKQFPQYHSLYYNYGLFLDEQDKYQEAARALRFALLMSPTYVKASNLLSLTVTRLHDLNSALRYVRWAVTSNPRHYTCWLNYGSHLRAMGHYSRALTAFKQTEDLAREQGDVEETAAGRFNRGMTYVSIGEIETGFHLLESRWATKGFPSPRRNFRQPIWRGPQTHPDANLLVYMEQGMGDEVMMSWYFPLLRRDTRRLLVDCDERLVDLFARTYEGIEFVPRSPKGHDRTRDPALQYKVPVVHVAQYYAPELKHLMRDNWHWDDLRGTRLPARLALHPDRLEHWDRWLEERYPGRPRLALSWRSKMRNRMRNQQYLTIDELAAAMPEGVVAINLQYSSTEEEIAELRDLGKRKGFEVVTPDGVDLTDDLEEVLALLQVSDAAVTPMISLAWMAGAVGCPGFIFRSSRERRIWQQFGTPFVPWAPSLRLFFRHPSETWDPTIRDLNRSLTRFLSQGSGRQG